MKKTREPRRRFLTGIFGMMLALGIFGGCFFLTGTVSCAETQVKVTSPKGAKVRQEASTSSAQVGGAENGKLLTVLNQVQGADGYTWYQVQLNSTTTGYVRSDLVEVSQEGTTDPSAGNEGGEGGGDAPAEVTAVNPVSASVAESGKIRDSASSEGQILAEVPAETVLTVTGQATAADGRVWYQVSYTGETQVDGFIRSDYVTLSEELTPYTEEPPAPEEPSVPEPDQGEEAPYEIVSQNGQWLLVDKVNNPTQGYSIEQFFSGVQNSAELLEESEKTVKSQKIIIIVLVFLLVAAAAGIAYLVYKLRDMMDSAYYTEVENETIRKRNAEKGGDRKVMHTVGTDRQPARPAGARPAGGTAAQRPAGTSQEQRGTGANQRFGGTSQGERTSGASQGQRTAGASQGQRAAGGASQGQRSAGSAQSQRGEDTVQGQRTRGSSQRVRGTGQGQRSSGTAQRQTGGLRPQQSSKRVQPKNFLEEDDEFEFEFLNYDGDEE